MRLRYFLVFIFFALALAPLLLFRAWPHSTVLQNELDEVHERHLLLARNLATALERYHRDISATFDLLLNEPGHWQDGSGVAEMLDNLLFRNICIADLPSGRVVTTIGAAKKPCPQTVPVETLTRILSFATDDSVQFGQVVGAPDGENIMHVAKLLPNNQIAIGAISTQYFVDLGEQISFGVLGHAAIVDHKGNVLAHPLPDWIAARKNIAKVSAVQRMFAGETGVETFFSPALKGDMIAGFTSVQPVGWGVMIPQPIVELYAKANEAHQSAMVVMLLGVGGALIMAMVVSIYTARPLERISGAAHSIAQGNLKPGGLAARWRFLPIEFKQLQANFANMVVRLRENIAMINTLAFVDGVTGLGNREYFLRRLKAIVGRNQTEDHGLLLFIDLDGFKGVNDTLGHDAGDEVLREVGQRLTRLMRIQPLENAFAELQSGLVLDGPADVVISRLGGDEYAMFVPYTAFDGQISELANDVLRVIGEPFSVRETKAYIGASIGIARFPDHGTDHTVLLKAADLAMYAAKRNGKNHCKQFAPRMLDEMAHRRAFAEEISAAFRAGEFVPYFQPQFRLEDMSVSGVEALVRWHHPTRGLLGPAAFLEAAEEMDVVREIDELVLSASLDLVKEIRASGVEVPLLSVNLSPGRLLDPSFIDSVRTKLPLDFQLNFELVESMFLDSVDDRTVWVLEELSEMGVGLELDDFGSGHASIIALLNLRPDTLKIDRHLVANMVYNEDPRALVKSIIDMGKSLGIQVTAEGIEDQSQIEMLASMGCDFAQGFELARPMTADQLREFLSAQGGVKQIAFEA